jgi:hypothetical protein
MDYPLILPSTLDARIIESTQQLACIEALLDTDINPAI